MLIHIGHVNIFEYEYSFFKTAVKTMEKVFKAQALAVTCGVGAIFDKNAMKELNK